MKQKPDNSTKIMTITVQLKGDQVDSFLDWKARQFIEGKAEAARKLILERLSQVKVSTEAA